MPAMPVTTPVDLTTMLGPLPQQNKGPSTSFDKDMFLKLLVAQLRYQNPLKPMDQSEFMAQAAQLAGVEQLQALGKAQTEAVAWQKQLTAASLVGKTVTGTSVEGTDVTGHVDRVSIAATGITLTIAGQSVPLASVTVISEDN